MRTGARALLLVVAAMAAVGLTGSPATADPVGNPLEGTPAEKAWDTVAGLDDQAGDAAGEPTGRVSIMTTSYGPCCPTARHETTLGSPTPIDVDRAGGPDFNVTVVGAPRSQAPTPPPPVGAGSDPAPQPGELRITIERVSASVAGMAIIFDIPIGDGRKLHFLADDPNDFPDTFKVSLLDRGTVPDADITATLDVSSGHTLSVRADLTRNGWPEVESVAHLAPAPSSMTLHVKDDASGTKIDFRANEPTSITTSVNLDGNTTMTEAELSNVRAGNHSFSTAGTQDTTLTYQGAGIEHARMFYQERPDPYSDIRSRSFIELDGVPSRLDVELFGDHVSITPSEPIGALSGWHTRGDAGARLCDLDACANIDLAEDRSLRAVAFSLSEVGATLIEFEDRIHVQLRHSGRDLAVDLRIADTLTMSIAAVAPPSPLVVTVEMSPAGDPTIVRYPDANPERLASVHVVVDAERPGMLLADLSDAIDVIDVTAADITPGSTLDLRAIDGNVLAVDSPDGIGSVDALITHDAEDREPIPEGRDGLRFVDEESRFVLRAVATDLFGVQISKTQRDIPEQGATERGLSASLTSGSGRRFDAVARTQDSGGISEVRALTPDLPSFAEVAFVTRSGLGDPASVQRRTFAVRASTSIEEPTSLSVLSASKLVEVDVASLPSHAAVELGYSSEGRIVEIAYPPTTLFTDLNMPPRNNQPLGSVVARIISRNGSTLVSGLPVQLISANVESVSPGTTLDLSGASGNTVLVTSDGGVGLAAVRLVDRKDAPRKQIPLDHNGIALTTGDGVLDLMLVARDVRRAHFRSGSELRTAVESEWVREYATDFFRAGLTSNSSLPFIADVTTTEEGVATDVEVVAEGLPLASEVILGREFQGLDTDPSQLARRTIGFSGTDPIGRVTSTVTTAGRESTVAMGSVPAQAEFQLDYDAGDVVRLGYPLAFSREGLLTNGEKLATVDVDMRVTCDCDESLIEGADVPVKQIVANVSGIPAGTILDLSRGDLERVRLDAPHAIDRAQVSLTDTIGELPAVPQGSNGVTLDQASDRFRLTLRTEGVSFGMYGSWMIEDNGEITELKRFKAVTSSPSPFVAKIGTVDEDGRSTTVTTSTARLPLSSDLILSDTYEVLTDEIRRLTGRDIAWGGDALPSPLRVKIDDSAKSVTLDAPSVPSHVAVRTAYDNISGNLLSVEYPGAHWLDDDEFNTTSIPRLDVVLVRTCPSDPCTHSLISGIPVDRFAATAIDVSPDTLLDLSGSADLVRVTSPDGVGSVDVSIASSRVGAALQIPSGYDGVSFERLQGFYTDVFRFRLRLSDVTSGGYRRSVAAFNPTTQAACDAFTDRGAFCQFTTHADLGSTSTNPFFVRVATGGSLVTDTVEVRTPDLPDDLRFDMITDERILRQSPPWLPNQVETRRLSLYVNGSDDLVGTTTVTQTGTRSRTTVSADDIASSFEATLGVRGPMDQVEPQAFNHVWYPSAMSDGMDRSNGTIASLSMIVESLDGSDLIKALPKVRHIRADAIGVYPGVAIDLTRATGNVVVVEAEIEIERVSFAMASDPRQVPDLEDEVDGIIFDETAGKFVLLVEGSRIGRAAFVTGRIAPACVAAGDLIQTSMTAELTSLSPNPFTADISTVDGGVITDLFVDAPDLPPSVTLRTSADLRVLTATGCQPSDTGSEFSYLQYRGSAAIPRVAGGVDQITAVRILEGGKERLWTRAVGMPKEVDLCVAADMDCYNRDAVDANGRRSSGISQSIGVSASSPLALRYLKFTRDLDRPHELVQGWNITGQRFYLATDLEVWTTACGSDLDAWIFTNNTPVSGRVIVDGHDPCDEDHEPTRLDAQLDRVNGHRYLRFEGSDPFPRTFAGWTMSCGGGTDVSYYPGIPFLIIDVEDNLCTSWT